MKIKITELKDLMNTVLTAEGNYSYEQAEKVSEVLLFAEMNGKNTQGILKLLRGGDKSIQSIKSKKDYEIVKDTPVSALIDGGGTAGALIAQVATDIAIKKASETGIAVVGTKNTFSSTGAIGFYANKMAQSDLIGIVAAGSPRSALHFGGIDPVYGTNPMAFGFPTEEVPVVFDAATSASTYYGFVSAKFLGKEISENLAVDADGNPTTDPAQAMDGAILPFDRSYKGSGFAMVVEMLSGVLTGASYSFDDGDWGNFFLAFSPDILGDTEEFKRRSSDFIRKVKESRTSHSKSIQIPGYDRALKTQGIKEIELEDRLLDKLKALASK